MKSKNIIDIELFRNRLRDRYKELGYTRKSLSKKADVSESTLDKWLNGKDNNDAYIPSLNTVYKVANALEVSVDYFINPDMDCDTVLNQKIKDCTGLNNNAIEVLKKDKKLYDYDADYDTPQALNSILDSDKGKYLLHDIYSYLHSENNEFIGLPNSDSVTSDSLWLMQVETDLINMKCPQTTTTKRKGIQHHEKHQT